MSNRAMHDAGDLATTVAIGLLAYLSADVAHHVLGHGLACLALGGEIRSLSSIFVDCTLTGATIDLAGPAANLALGIFSAILVVNCRRLPRLLQLFLVLVAGFNLYWLFLQLVVSAATRTDDWAWPMQVYGIHGIARWILIAVGIVGYKLTTRFLRSRFGSLEVSFVRRVVLSAWLSAGALAVLTAAFDKHPLPAIFLHALPQSLGLSIGLLWVPTKHADKKDQTPSLVHRSWPWITSAIGCSILSALILGRGVSVALK